MARKTTHPGYVKGAFFIIILLIASIISVGLSGINLSLTNRADETSMHPLIDSRRIFLTSTQVTGNLGGLAGADSICQQKANAANLGGSWKAWLSSGTVSASSRLIHFTGPYTRVDGSLIANNWTDLTDGVIQGTINIDEFGTPYNASLFFANVRTNTNTDGSITSTNPALNCQNWTSNSLNYDGYGGYFVRDNFNWTSGGSERCSVTNTSRLYCVEQTPPSPTPTIALTSCFDCGLYPDEAGACFIACPASAGAGGTTQCVAVQTTCGNNTQCWEHTCQEL